MRRRRTTRTPRARRARGRGSRRRRRRFRSRDPRRSPRRQRPALRFADRYQVPDGVLYMDGNSLGPATPPPREPRPRRRRVARPADRGVDRRRPAVVRSGERLGGDARAAARRRAEPSEVVVGNSITVNIHTLVGTFLDELLAGNGPGAKASSGRTGRGRRRGIPRPIPPSSSTNSISPDHHYAIRAQLRQRGIGPDEKLRVVESRDGRTIDSRDIEAALAHTHDDIGIVFMPTALYRAGQLFDVARIAPRPPTRRARTRGSTRRTPRARCRTRSATPPASTSRSGARLTSSRA